MFDIFFRTERLLVQNRSLFEELGLWSMASFRGDPWRVTLLAGDRFRRELPLLLAGPFAGLWSQDAATFQSLGVHFQVRSLATLPGEDEQIILLFLGGHEDLGHALEALKPCSERHLLAVVPKGIEGFSVKMVKAKLKRGLPDLDIVEVIALELEEALRFRKQGGAGAWAYSGLEILERGLAEEYKAFGSPLRGFLSGLLAKIPQEPRTLGKELLRTELEVLLLRIEGITALHLVRGRASIKDVEVMKILLNQVGGVAEIRPAGAECYLECLSLGSSELADLRNLGGDIPFPCRDLKALVGLEFLDARLDFAVKQDTFLLGCRFQDSSIVVRHHATLAIAKAVWGSVLGGLQPRVELQDHSMCRFFEGAISTHQPDLQVDSLSETSYIYLRRAESSIRTRVLSQFSSPVAGDGVRCVFIQDSKVFLQTDGDNLFQFCPESGAFLRRWKIPERSGLIPCSTSIPLLVFMSVEGALSFIPLNGPPSYRSKISLPASTHKFSSLSSSGKRLWLGNEKAIAQYDLMPGLTEMTEIKSNCTYLAEPDWNITGIASVIPDALVTAERAPSSRWSGLLKVYDAEGSFIPYSTGHDADVFHITSDGMAMIWGKTKEQERVAEILDTRTGQSRGAVLDLFKRTPIALIQGSGFWLAADSDRRLFLTQDGVTRQDLAPDQIGPLGGPSQVERHVAVKGDLCAVMEGGVVTVLRLEHTGLAAASGGGDPSHAE